MSSLGLVGTMHAEVPGIMQRVGKYLARVGLSHGGGGGQKDLLGSMNRGHCWTEERKGSKPGYS
jgi:hypothetical protein